MGASGRRGGVHQKDGGKGIIGQPQRQKCVTAVIWVYSDMFFNHLLPYIERFLEFEGWRDYENGNRDAHLLALSVGARVHLCAPAHFPNPTPCTCILSPFICCFLFIYLPSPSFSSILSPLISECKIRVSPWIPALFFGSLWEIWLSSLLLCSPPSLPSPSFILLLLPSFARSSLGISPLSSLRFR